MSPRIGPGAGPLGEAIVRVWPAIQNRLDEQVEGTTRRAAWSKALRESVDYWRTHRRDYTNQSMIVDRNIYTANRALELIDPPNALSDDKVMHCLYEAVGLEPWLGSDIPDHADPTGVADASSAGVNRPFGEHYHLVSKKGLTRELGYVGTYGETILHFTHDIAELTGDAKIRGQLATLEAARMYFRYPAVDGEGFRCMKLASEIDNRTAHYPLSGSAYTAPNIREEWWMDIPAMLSDDPVAVGAAQQSLSDRQYFRFIRLKRSELKNVDMAVISGVTTLRKGTGSCPPVCYITPLASAGIRKWRLISRACPDFRGGLERMDFACKFHRDTVLRTVPEALLFANRADYKSKVPGAGWKPVSQLRSWFPGNPGTPDFEPRTICFRVEQAAGTFRCSCCASSNVRKSGVVPRRFRTVPIGGKQVFIELPIQRLLCFDCCKTRQVKIGFADPRFGYTRSFERYALDLSRRTTIQHAAEHLKAGWDTIKDIQKRKLHRRFKNIRLRHLKHLAIDEISIGHGQTVPELSECWTRINQQLAEGTYKPLPVKRVEISKPDGPEGKPSAGMRKLGIPTVLDRFIQQAVQQVLSGRWDSTFPQGSFGFRPGKSAHQAVEAAQRFIADGCAWVVDIDLEKFFDRVNHDRLMARIMQRENDKALIKLIRSILTSGVMENGLVSPIDEGTPQGGPFSPPTIVQNAPFGA